MADEFLGINDAALSSAGLDFLADSQILVVCRWQVGQLLGKLAVFDLVRFEDVGLTCPRRKDEGEVLQQHKRRIGAPFHRCQAMSLHEQLKELRTHNVVVYCP